jgi:hypothetical protein
MMILIKDLGLRETKNSGKRKFGIFACPICHEEKERMFYHKAKKCKRCEQKARITHGKSHKPIYNVWRAMKQRCYNKKNPAHKDYGDRGIDMCSDWKNSFESFYQWACSHGYREGLSIDRIDNNLGYNQDNCRFITQTIQSRNTRVLYAHNSTGYRGICRFKKHGKNPFVAGIKINGKRVHIGVYSTAIEAAKAYDNFIKINNLEHACNF